MVPITDKIGEEIIKGLKAKEALRVGVLRMVKAAIKNKEIELKRELDDGELVAILRSQVKSREESMQEFEKGGRTDLAIKEMAEAAIIKEFLPQGLNKEELEIIVRESIRESGAATGADIGKVMPLAVAKAKGRAGGKEIRDIAMAMLGANG